MGDFTLFLKRIGTVLRFWDALRRPKSTEGLAGTWNQTQLSAFQASVRGISGRQGHCLKYCQLQGSCLCPLPFAECQGPA